MKKREYKRRCEKFALSKCDGICKAYTPIQSVYANMLENDPTIKNFRCNVQLENFSEGDYTTDFVAVKTDGDLMVRECVYRILIVRPRTMKLLEASRMYWLNHGVDDWGIVIDEEK